MYDPKLTFLTYELNYRTERIHEDMARSRRRRRRTPRLVRPAVASRPRAVSAEAPFAT